ncbi:SulP family inorganic anion transporter [Pseudomonas leptonychotis]|uniref:SulP family inorganic anion transporter n=1 Tax=Pseudomonas leptonychotis TaxID=2448482 RepID=A0A4T1ZVM7_9PSED|nr:SulP family inorganic anion transporter [Pseudomonas leptonychotis]TIH08483.1 SulP family inorganic anion transporter [Pseudomonas leptonychotis]
MPLPRLQSLLPFLRWLPACNKRSLGIDLLVGLNGAILALPQSIAYALIAGLPPQYGLYAAIVPVLIACLWGSSSYLICGPTAAMSIVLLSSVSPMATPGSDDFIALILLLTLLVGVCQWLLGLLRFGALVNFVSHSVVLGFTLGAALVIGIGQLPNLLGLPATSQATGLMNLLSLGEHLAESDWRTLAVALFTLAISLLSKRLSPRVPALLIGIVAASLLVMAWPEQLGAIALVSRFEGSLPPFALLEFNLSDILQLLPAAVACGLLGLVTSLSIARALADKSQQPFDANQEVRAQGLSNIIGPWFNGSLSAGSFTRSALNQQAGACSPMAGVFAALLVALFALHGSRLFAYVPIPAMAASILLICWGLFDTRAIKTLQRVNRSEFLVMLLTVLATLVLELQSAIYAGVLASLVVYLKRTSQPRVRQWQDGEQEWLCIEGSIFFGACHYLQQRLQRSGAPWVMIDARHINFIDYAGIAMLHQEARRLHSQQRHLVLHHARSQVIDEIRKLEGPEHCPVQFTT